MSGGAYHIATQRSLSIKRDGGLTRIGMFCIMALCLVAPWGTYTQFATLVTLATVPIFLLAAVLVLSIVSERNGLKPFDFITMPILLIVAASSMWSDFVVAWDERAFWYAACVVTYFGVRVFVRTPEHYRSIAIAGGIGGLIAVVMIEPGQPSIEFGGAVLRSAVPDHNPNFTAYSLAGAIFNLLAFARYCARNDVERWSAFTVCAIMFYGIIVLDTRGAQLAVGLMALWYFISSFGFGRYAHLVVWPAFAGALLFSLGLLEWIGPAIEGIVPSERRTGDLSGRVPTWELARGLISDEPFLGVGLGGFEIISPYGIGAHNLFLTLALDLGLIGLALFMLFLTRGLWSGLRMRGPVNDKIFVAMFTCYFLPIAVTGHFEVAPFAWVVLGFAFSALRD